MTSPTDPRVEAAAREMCLSAVDGDERVWNEMSERDKGYYRRRCVLILRAADEAIAATSVGAENRIASLANPQVEAVARVLYQAMFPTQYDDETCEKTKEDFRKDAKAALKAADEATWSTDIKKAPGSRQTVMVQLKCGRVTFANNEFPQGEDGWVDLLWPTDGHDIAEGDIVAWRLIPRYTP